MKICSQCDQSKDLSYYSKDCTKKDGLCNACKQCKSEYKKVYTKQNAEKISKYNFEWKQKYFKINGKHSGCKYSPQELEQRNILATELRNKRVLNAKRNQKRFTELKLIVFDKSLITHKRCNDCKKTISVSDYHKDSFRNNLYSTRCKYCQSQISEIRKIKGTRKIENAKYRKTELYKLNNKHRYLTDKYKMQSIIRREKKSSLGESNHIPKKLNTLVKERFEYQCFQCGANNDLTIDHHYPLSKGKRLTLDNAVLLCRSCNSKTNKKFPEDYYNYAEIERLKTLGINTNSRE